MRRLLRNGFALFMLLASPFTLAADSLVAHDAWVREAPPGAVVLAAYLVLENQGAQTDGLIGVTSPDFEAVDIHTTEVRAGVARMIALEKLPLPAHGQVVFAPGGNHLMLLRPRHPLAAGSHVTLDLHFASGTRLTVVAPVQAGAGPAHQR